MSAQTVGQGEVGMFTQSENVSGLGCSVAASCTKAYIMRPRQVLQSTAVLCMILR